MAHDQHARKMFRKRKIFPKVKCLNCNNPDLWADNSCPQCGDKVYFHPCANDFYGENYDKEFTIDTIDSDDAIEIYVYSKFHKDRQYIGKDGLIEDEDMSDTDISN